MSDKLQVMSFVSLFITYHFFVAVISQLSPQM